MAERLSERLARRRRMERALAGKLRDDQNRITGKHPGKLIPPDEEQRSSQRFAGTAVLDTPPDGAFDASASWQPPHRRAPAHRTVTIVDEGPHLVPRARNGLGRARGRFARARGHLRLGGSWRDEPPRCHRWPRHPSTPLEIPCRPAGHGPAASTRPLPRHWPTATAGTLNVIDRNPRYHQGQDRGGDTCRQMARRMGHVGTEARAAASRRLRIAEGKRPRSERLAMRWQRQASATPLREHRPGSDLAALLTAGGYVLEDRRGDFYECSRSGHGDRGVVAIRGGTSARGRGPEAPCSWGLGPEPG